MRKIEFRGKTSFSKVWAYSRALYYSENGNTYFVYVDEENDDEVYFEQVDPETVGQFTGLLDKNGKKIYEGDIIHIKGHTIDTDYGVVTWHQNGYFYIDDSFGEFPRDCVKPIGDFFECIRSNYRCCLKDVSFYVSGNIHDKKELLKKKEY